jgi:hypothetical protein
MRRSRKLQADNGLEDTKTATGQPSTLEKIRVQRLAKYRHQNSKLAIEVKKLKGQVVSAEDLKQEVLAANTTVKTQMLALPFQNADKLAAETDPREIQRMLYDAVVQCLNDLAYERERPPQPGICPCCGKTL